MLTSLMSLALFGSALAFEPGTERVCAPSADGQTFECRDKGESADKAVIPAPSAPVVPESVAATSPPPADETVAAEATPASAAPVTAKRLPNYLMQKPEIPATTSEPVAAPTPPSEQTEMAARDVQRSRAAEISADEPVRAESGEIATSARSAPPSTLDAPRAPQAEEAYIPVEPANVTQREPVIEQAPSPRSPPPPVAPPAAAPQPPSSAAGARRNVSGADAFLALPAGHYTIVLASVRNRAALDGLIAALDALPSQLYLLPLGMPDGEWYSLCWAEFDDLDAARAARASLPADAAITSGWPRRIGLLQKELTH